MLVKQILDVSVWQRCWNNRISGGSFNLESEIFYATRHQSKLRVCAFVSLLIVRVDVLSCKHIPVQG